MQHTSHQCTQPPSTIQQQQLHILPQPQQLPQLPPQQHILPPQQPQPRIQQK